MHDVTITHEGTRYHATASDDPGLVTIYEEDLFIGRGYLTSEYMIMDCTAKVPTEVLSQLEDALEISLMAGK